MITICNKRISLIDLENYVIEYINKNTLKKIVLENYIWNQFSSQDQGAEP